MNWEAFFTLHHDLPREGPGHADDVEWAVRQAGVIEGARILDAGSGPGGDIAALLDAVPGAHVTAVDTHAEFIETIAGTHDPDRVDARQSSMRDVVGPFDFIWSAGAVYFVGVTAALTDWRSALTQGGHIAFSHPVFFTDSPAEGARAFWDGDPVDTLATARAKIAEAGYEIIADRALTDAAWDAYYEPLLARVAALRPDADEALSEVLDTAQAEVDGWRAHRTETGYQLFVVRPV